jgi:hypothetical protein
MSAAASTEPEISLEVDMFVHTFAVFCSELRETFPELEESIRRVEGRATPLFFWNSWKHDLDILAKRDFVALQEKRRGILFVPVVMTQTWWDEISATSRAAIWHFLRTLILEAVRELELDASHLTTERIDILVDILKEERAAQEKMRDTRKIIEESVHETVAAEIEEDMSVVLTRLRESLQSKLTGSPLDVSGFADMLGVSGELPAGVRGLFEKNPFDASGLAGMFDASGGFSLPEIPDHLRNGRIARLAEQLVRQLDPSDFGIDPAVLSGNNIEEVFRGLVELYQRDPSTIMSGVKRLGEKIKHQISGGTMDMNALAAEAKEFVEIFRNHPTFKEPISQFEGLLGEGGLAEMFSSVAGAGAGDGGASSERLRAVQERLRKKLAAREAAKKTGGGSK